MFSVRAERMQIRGGACLSSRLVVWASFRAVLLGGRRGLSTETATALTSMPVPPTAESLMALRVLAVPPSMTRTRAAVGRTEMLLIDGRTDA
jgi:hypothetical protein